jgi:c-di-GMP-specific phosphodiesterase
MADFGLFGWRRSAMAASYPDIARGADMATRAAHQRPEAEDLLTAAAAADCLLWIYDAPLGRFEFYGDTAALGLTDMSGRLSPQDLAPMLAAGEVERLEAALHTLDVLTAADLPGEGAGAGHVQCVLRLKDQRCLYLKGRRTSRVLAMGTLTDLSRDVRRGDDAAVDARLQDIHIDVLTGLHSRQGFLKTAQAVLTRPGDYDLVVGDLNRFRRLNEALGHERADRVLAMLGQRLRDAFPPADHTVLARLGEDEFAVLTQRGFPRVSERMRLALERSLNIAGFDIHPTFSMGAVSVEGGETALDSGELLRRAEMAVDVAQSKGAGGVAAYKRDLESDGLTRLALEAELRKAFVSGEIHAWYQPIVNLETGVIAGFEALARWAHPKRGIIPPDHFLTATRDLGMMTDLGAIIMNDTVRLMARWFRDHDLPDGFFISVNLSAPEIERLHLIEDVSRLIRDHDLPRKALKLEVTESDVMRDPVASARVLEALRNAGAGIALDDFGTGFSSLSYLAKLPFDTLKIDRSFVSTLSREESSEKIVRSILRLGYDLGLDVVAEGVEDMALARRLHDLGCGLGQGYGFAKALKAPEAEQFLATSLAQAGA